MSKVKIPEYAYLGISDEAKKIFDEIVDEYSEKINPILDFALLANYSEACVRLKLYYEASNGKNMIVKSRNGETYVHPLQKLIKDERDEISRCASKLGLEPSSRSKIKTETSTTTGRPLRGFKARMLSKQI